MGKHVFKAPSSLPNTTTTRPATGEGAADGRNIGRHRERLPDTPATPPTAQEPTEQTNVCFICADQGPRFWTVGPCGHPYCGLCGLRLRALFNTRSCPWCKRDHDIVSISTSKDTPYPAGAALTEGPLADIPLGIVFDRPESKTTVLSWMALRCPLCSSTAASPSKHALKEHLGRVHRKAVCPVCLAHKPVFPFEWQLFSSPQQLHKHTTVGDSVVRHGHPRCQICPSRHFYSADDLAVHCRESHELCHICTRHGSIDAYFKDYAALEEHFAGRHYLCREPLCQELKFVVFANELEFKAHVRQVHLTGQRMQRSQQRQLSRIELSFLDSSVHRGQARDRREGRDTNASSATANVQQGQATHNAPPPRRNIDEDVLFFNVAELRGNVQALADLEDQSRAFLVQHPTLAHLKPLVREFVDGQRSAQDIVAVLHKAVPDLAALKAMGGRLAALVPNRMRQHELEGAVSGHIKRIEAFPSLPRAKETSSIMPKEPIRGRIVMSPQPRSQARVNATVDPARHPQALVGSSRPSRRSATFNQAVTGAAFGGNNASRASSSAQHPPRLQGDQRGVEDGDVFVIGKPQSTGRNDGVGKREGKKKQVLMRFGSLYSPQT